MNRCFWVDKKSEIYVNYHDNEWARPSFDDNYLFEMLVLESFQSGLSWLTILKKREYFRIAFDNFSPTTIANYKEKKIQELLNNPNIIRHRGKIQSTVTNAKIFLDIQKEFGSFSNYIWGFTDGKVIKNKDDNFVTHSELSDRISKDLKKRGMKYLGSTTVYSYLEAIGILNNHSTKCFKYDFKEGI